MSALGDYYRSMAAENAAKTTTAYAQTQNLTAQTQEVGQNAQSTRDLQAAQAAGQRAGAAKNLADTAQVAPNAQSQRALDSSRSALNDITGDINQRTAQADIAFKGLQGAALGLANRGAAYNAPVGYNAYGRDTTGSMSALPSAGGTVIPSSVPLAMTGTDPDQAQGFSKGGTVKGAKKGGEIQGKSKPGPTDTVPTMLTPGEAVLNKGAAEHYGSDVIDHMNRMGLMRMAAQSEHAQLNGQPDPHAAPPAAKGKKPAAKAPAKGEAVQGFARGTSKVVAMRSHHGMPDKRKRKA